METDQTKRPQHECKNEIALSMNEVNESIYFKVPQNRNLPNLLVKNGCVESRFVQRRTMTDFASQLDSQIRSRQTPLSQSFSFFFALKC